LKTAGTLQNNITSNIEVGDVVVLLLSAAASVLNFSRTILEGRSTTFQKN